MSVRIEYSPRVAFGCRNTRILRESGFVPAVVYGGGAETISIALSVREVDKKISSLMSKTVVELSCGDVVHKVIPKAYELHPVTSAVLHLDFVFASDNVSKFEVPLNFINKEKSEAIKLGAVLNIVRRTALVKCSSSNLPKSIPVDIEHSKVGDSIKLSDLMFADGVTPIAKDADSVVATIVGKKAKGGAASTAGA
ncbi:ribosomal protein L25, Ctc-form [Neorickettsia helminthoeca str. Oregon]|uniref:Large ribosomal subunit protein bL25 n=1 Tax=Neorickettsia helminthoeca str. Oregon TaxID=1286528 RepID=X5GVZ3_9RICK|nr:50S ribosomal protein L25 [Neorickettsia helminthoeca]AHX11247.1 ribosomal protein L25, Ctc-form [Neorickettsia helminthoeca str. Oregon]